MSAGYQVNHPKFTAPRVYSCGDCGVCDCFHKALKMARSVGNGATVTRVSDGRLLSEVRKEGRAKDDSVKPLRKGRVNRQWGDTKNQRAQLTKEAA